MYAAIARLRHIPVIVIWGGSDVVQAVGDAYGSALLRHKAYYHIADAPWLADELRTLGIDAHYVPVLGVPVEEPAKEFPARFSAITYLPSPRRDFYGARLVYQAARRFPDVPFRVVGNGKSDFDAPANVEFLGQLGNIEPVLNDSVVLVRMPEHDGMSRMVLETLAAGRYVIRNRALPGVVRADDEGQLIAALGRLRSEYESGALGLNVDGLEFVARHFSPQRIVHGIERALSAAHPRVRRVPGRQGTVAISGRKLFVAEFFEPAEAGVTGWRHRLLAFGSRFDVVLSLVKMCCSRLWYTIGPAPGPRALELLADGLRKPRVMHWSRNDVTRLAETPGRMQMLTRAHVHHVAGADWTAEELRKLGLRASVAPLPPHLCTGSICEMPEVFTVLLYVAPRHKGSHVARSYERLIGAFRGRGVKFVIVGGGTLNVSAGDDVVNLGWHRSLQNVYETCSALVRCEEHDDLSLMVLEALSYGRHVIWTQEFPYTRHAEDYSIVEQQLGDLVRSHMQGNLLAQTAAAAYVRRRYARSLCLETIARIWGQAAGSRSVNASTVKPGR